MAKNNIINVKLFGQEIGRIGLDIDAAKSSFQYNPEFLKAGNFFNAFPKTGIIRKVSQAQTFSQFNNATFKGLPPQIADSLPDLFGNLIFKTWIDTNEQKEITALEQLAYVSNRGMGALEYEPSIALPKNSEIDLAEIIEVLKSVMDIKKESGGHELNSDALINIFKIGTSAGGARPKIIISEHKASGKIQPGDLSYSDDYDHYLVKLALEDEINYPREIVEYCYYLTAKEVGITMMDSKLIDDKHFATQRYDRIGGKKIHSLTATGLTGWDFKDPEPSSYENLFKLASFLKVPHAQSQELYKRMIFNLVFRNSDDHLKNHAFIYDPKIDRWFLSPAYDLTYPLNPLLHYKKTSRALSVNGKRTDINLKDVLKIAEMYTIKNPKGIIKDVTASISSLESHMKAHDVGSRVRESILGKASLGQLG